MSQIFFSYYYLFVEQYVLLLKRVLMNTQLSFVIQSHYIAQQQASQNQIFFGKKIVRSYRPAMSDTLSHRLGHCASHLLSETMLAYIPVRLRTLLELLTQIYSLLFMVCKPVPKDASFSLLTDFLIFFGSDFCFSINLNSPNYLCTFSDIFLPSS